MNTIVLCVSTENKYFTNSWHNDIEYRTLPLCQLNQQEPKKISFDQNIFLIETSFDVVVNYLNRNDPNNIDNIESITLVTKLKDSNEMKLKVKMKNNVENVIKKRKVEIDMLKKERLSLIEKSDNIFSQSDTDINDTYKEFELVCEQIRNHYLEIYNVQQEVEIEIEDNTNEYSITLYRDKIKYINGLPGQKKQFSLCWFQNEDKNAVTKPINIVNRKRSVSVSYSELVNLKIPRTEPDFSDVY